MKKRIYIDHSPVFHRYNISFNFTLHQLSNGFIIEGKDSDFEQASKFGLTIRQVELLQELKELLEGQTVVIFSDSVELHMNIAYKFSEVCNIVVPILHKIYGDFTVKKISPIRRFMYVLRRNIFQPLCPILYK